MSQKHAPDEFDLVVGSTGRRGAHRPPPGRAAGLLPVLLVVVVVTAVVLGVVTLLGTSPPESAITTSGAPGAPVTPTSTPTSTPTATPSGDGSPTSSSPPETTPADDTSSEVDRTAAVTVLNGTRTKGLAGKAAAALSSDGWDVARTDNYRDGSPPTTVFYGSPRLRATAEAVAEALGGAQVQLDDAAAEQITVVLGTDYAGA